MPVKENYLYLLTASQYDDFREVRALTKSGSCPKIHFGWCAGPQKCWLLLAIWKQKST
jgi:hypothetical protein